MFRSCAVCNLCAMNWSRRGFLAMVMGRCFGSALSIELLRESSAAWSAAQTRTYRADVLVTFLGVPLFSRRGAGSAVASLRECVQDRRRRVAVSFAGGSDPSRTHGVNYAGSLEEIAVESGSELSEAATFGFVTSPGQDESFEQARRRVISEADSGSFVVVDELHRSGAVRIRKATVSAPGGWGAPFGQMRRDVRVRFMESAPVGREFAMPGGAVPATFLYTVLAAVRWPERKSSFEYVHNGKRYALNSEKTGTRLSGQIHDMDTKHNSTFRLWFEEGSDLPVRIEFSPRSYLRITLERDAEMNTKEDV
jgi:hypothetical protein